MPQQLEELVGRYLDGRADAEEVRRLDQAVQSDRQVARMLVEMAALESQLGQILSLQRTAAEIVTDQPPVAAAAESPLAARTRQAKKQQRRWRIMGIATAAAACAAVVALMVFNLMRPEPIETPTDSPLVAEVIEIHGTIERLAGGTGQPGGLSAGDLVQPGDKFRVDSAPGSLLVLQYPDETTVWFFQNASGGLVDASDAKRVQLDAGRLLADITSQPTGREMMFLTPDAQAKVIGTQLRLTALPKSSVLEVIRGEVEFKRLQEPQFAIVSARERIGSAANLPFRPRPLPPPAGRIPLPPHIDQPVGLAHDGVNLWVSNGLKIYTLSVLDGAIHETAVLDVSEHFGPHGAKGLAWDGISLWVADYYGSRIVRMDPVTGTIQQQFSTMARETEDSAKSRQITDVAIAGGYVWALGRGDVENGDRGTVIYQWTVDGELLDSFQAPPNKLTYFAITEHDGNVCLHGVGSDRPGRIYVFPAESHDGQPIRVYRGAKANTIIHGLCSDRSGRLWMVNAGIHDRTGIRNDADDRWIQAIEFTELQEVNQP